MTIKIKFYHMINKEWFAYIFQKAVKKERFLILSLHRVTLEVQWSSNRALHGSRLALWVSVKVVLCLIFPVCTPECQTIRTGSLSMSGRIMRVSSLLPPLLLCRMRMWLVLQVCFLTSPWQRKIQLSITETVIQLQFTFTSPPLSFFSPAPVCGGSAGLWPWMASVTYRNNPMCVGTLVSDLFVLTSASCFAR